MTTTETWQDAYYDGGPPPPDDPPKPGIRDKFLTLAQLRSLPPVEPLITGLLDLDSLAMIYGPRGSYKSFITLDWALSVACGTRWQERTVAQNKVVYVAAEGV